MKYSIRHQTRYLYSSPASISHNRLHSRPRDCAWQLRGEPNLVIEPEPACLNHQTDYFGNPVSFFTVQKPHKELNVVVMFETEVRPRGDLSDNNVTWDAVQQLLRETPDSRSLEASQFRFDSAWARQHPELTDYAGESFSKGRPIVEASLEFCRRIFEDFEFDNTATDMATPLLTVFEQRKGVCQDFAHLAIAGLRGLGLSARYVSGYLRTVPPPGQERLQGADASHAWLSVWTPQGWVDLDPTNNCLVGQDHITLAWGRDYHDVCPLRGVVLGGGSQIVRVGVDVIPQ